MWMEGSDDGSGGAGASCSLRVEVGARHAVHSVSVVTAGVVLTPAYTEVGSYVSTVIERSPSCVNDDEVTTGASNLAHQRKLKVDANHDDQLVEGAPTPGKAQTRLVPVEDEQVPEESSQRRTGWSIGDIVGRFRGQKTSEIDVRTEPTEQREPKQVRKPPADGWRIMPRLGERGDEKFKGSQSEWGRLSDERPRATPNRTSARRRGSAPRIAIPSADEVVALDDILDQAHLGRLLPVAVRDIERGLTEPGYEARYRVRNLDRLLERLNPGLHLCAAGGDQPRARSRKEPRRAPARRRDLSQLKSKEPRDFFKGHEYRFPVYPEDAAPLGSGRLLDHLSMLFMTEDNIASMSSDWSRTHGR